MKDSIITLLLHLNILGRLAACRTLMSIYDNYTRVPGSQRHRKLESKSYDEIIKYLGPLEQYAVFHKAHMKDSYHITSIDKTKVWWAKCKTYMILVLLFACIIIILPNTYNIISRFFK